MFIHFTDIINNLINYIKSKLLVNPENTTNSEIFQNLFNKIYEERCKTIQSELLPDVLPIVDDVYVIGDIHGDYDKLIKLLVKSNVISIEEINNTEINNEHLNIIKINNKKVIQDKVIQDTNVIQDTKVIKDKNQIIRWIGKESVVVQVGDQIDRCRENCDSNQTDDKNDDWKILKFMTLLNEISNQYNGKVYSLLGNHEIMNTQYNFNYVSKKGKDNFLEDYDKNYLNQFNKNINDNENIKNTREYAFKIGNEISNFLACTRKLCIIVGSNVFVHGGITSYIAQKYNVYDMNTIVNLYLFDSLKLSELNNNNKIKKIADVAIGDLLSINTTRLNSYLSPIWNRDLNNLLLDINEDKQMPKWIRNLNGVPKKNCKKLNDNLQIFFNNSRNNISPLYKNNISPLYKNTVVKVGSIIVGHTPQLKDGQIKSRCDNKVWLTDYGSSIAFKNYKNDTWPKIQVLHIHKDNIFKIIS